MPRNSGAAELCVRNGDRCSCHRISYFVRFCTSTPPLPDTALTAAQTKGRERYEGYVEALGRRLARGRKLSDEIVRDVTEKEFERSAGQDK